MLKELVLEDALREKMDAAHTALNLPSSLTRGSVEEAEDTLAAAIMLLEDVQGRIRSGSGRST